VKLRLEQNLKQIQTINMTQEMRLGIELLQKNMLDLREFLIEEVASNPFLEVEDWGDDSGDEYNHISEGDSDKKTDNDFESEPEKTDDMKLEGNFSDLIAEFDWNSYKDNSGNSFGDTHVRKKNDYDDSEFSFENVLASEVSLPEKLDVEIASRNLPEHIKEIMVYMAYNLDSMGFLRESDSDIAEMIGVSEADVTIARDAVKRLDPEGIGCESFKDYLKFMCSDPDRLNVDDDLFDLVQKFVSSDELLDMLANKDYEKLCHKLSFSRDDFVELISVIKKIPPFPSFGFDNFVAHTVAPDLRVHLINGEVVIEMEHKFIPTVKINSEAFEEQIKKIQDKDKKEFLRERYRAAKWLMDSLSERNQTLYQVASSIFNFQKSFIEFGEEFLKSLTLKDVAEDIERHQSTISRLTNGKYAATPHGIYELKYFFVKKINENLPTTNKHVETKILEIIEKEDKQNPYNDEDIAAMLSREGIDIARRTVAKYRMKMKILSARDRKRDYEFSLGG